MEALGVGVGEVEHLGVGGVEHDDLVHRLRVLPQADCPADGAVASLGSNGCVGDDPCAVQQTLERRSRAVTVDGLSVETTPQGVPETTVDP